MPVRRSGVVHGRPEIVHPALWLLLAVLTAGLLPLVAPTPAAAAQDPENELAQRFAPAVRLVAQEEPCGPGEPYIPSDVDAFMGEQTVALRGPWTENDLVQIAPTADDISDGLYEYHLDFPGDALNPGCSYERWAKRLTNGTDPTVYAHIATEESQPGQLALQYWFFYPFNDYNNLHEGDWEWIQLVFDASTPAEALQEDPTALYYSQHEGAEVAEWDDEKLELVDDTRPVVHPASGSHANYYDEGLFLGRSASQGVGCDDTRPPTRNLDPVVQVIPSDPTAARQQFPWIGFEGRWGERHEAFYNGPTGPAQKNLWRKPISEVEDRGRDRSYAIPAGGLLGTGATGFFCDAVAAGSDTLRRLLTQPAPVLIGFALVIGALMWAAIRTNWRPSAPLRLAHRRAWGQVYASATRMYIAYPALFVGIGLLAIPVSIVVAALHAGAIRVGALVGVDASGESGGSFVSIWVVLGTILTFFGVAIVHAATVRAVTEIDAGREIGVIRAFRLAVDRPRPLFGAVAIAVVVGSLLSLSVFLIPIAILLIWRWALIVPVAELEPDKVLETLNRSGALVWRQPIKIAWLVVVTAFIAIATGPVVGTILILITDTPLELINIVAGILYAFLIPFTGLTTTYAYYDTLVRERLAERGIDVDEVPAEV
jgi:hypothetical protein